MADSAVDAPLADTTLTDTPAAEGESTAARALAVLRRLTSRDDAQFHPGQLEAVTALVDDQRRTLVVQRTGWGKSAVYFVATALLRERGAGPSILISPLIALMRDQVAAAHRAGVRAVAISSANATEWDDIAAMLRDDTVDVLLVSPERLNNPRFRDQQLPDLVHRAGMLVIDEAHCVSDWGHDFRPDYRRIARLIEELPDGLPVLATTATANHRVVTDVAEQLGHDVLVQRGTLARDSLRLGCLQLPTSRDRLAWLVDHLPELPGSGIVYALTVSAAEDTARLLAEAGHSVAAYTGRTDADERIELEQRLRSNDLKALVATSALGMGFDKPDLGFVVHLGAPSSPVAYYQQVGRAGRATDHADVLLLPGREDRDIWQYFATASMPDPEKAAAVLHHLGPEPISVPALEARVDIRRSPLELLLKVLDVDGAVRRVSSGWVVTGQSWSYDAERYQRISRARQDEQDAMLTYQAGGRCRMEFLQDALDDPDATACGRCDVCAGPWYPTSVREDATAAASSTLDQVGVPIDPRKQWPTGAGRLGVELDGAPVSGNIAPGLRVEPGRVVARLTDLGWGTRLREIFAAGAGDHPIDDALFGAVTRTLRDWPWTQRPTTIVELPSARRPQLTASLTQRLAEVGHLVPLGALDVTGQPDDGLSGNSAFRLAAVWGRARVGAELGAALAANPGPVLLVSDVVDSRWSLTVAGLRLRSAGAESVLPFALASVG